MNPAFSVVLFTTLAGAAQGLVLALFMAEWAAGRHWFGDAPDTGLFTTALLLAAALATAGLLSSFFHLGKPMRGWRAVAQWRTSWLSREVIVLPLFIVLTLAYAAAHAMQLPAGFLIGALAALAALALFICTGMIYACIRFLREWATPLTPLNFTLLGLASGFVLAAALSAALAPASLRHFSAGALLFTLLGLLGRIAAWQRNRRLVPKSTLQSAIGIKHPRIEQRSQGFMGGSFNTREFFHGRGPRLLVQLRWVCVLAGFVMPLLLLVSQVPLALAAAVLIQLAGLLAERWLFFAEAQHPQNLYYQRMA
jgi:sulfite dehydrogenase (quinone) subunit SoeC